jgi:hypothetical protein
MAGLGAHWRAMVCLRLKGQTRDAELELELRFKRIKRDERFLL